MKDNPHIRITIYPVEGRPAEYMACFDSSFLQAQFCVYLKDSIFGALALQAFTEMVRKAFGKNYKSSEIDFQVSQTAIPFHSRPLLDILDDKQHACCA